ncbi:uncharacterized protein LOC101221543 isoform X3 [Cucumis sativus]|uniref:Uncharacterized protein n=1 Tax=Cucumis sativus TaxID=3659 RepID=A0A0A0KQH2_CUCSA|nr:uncharacterized protein LOC101221543 isoform X2 [Cucumis sativus]XP_011655268.1 uncharacterized protein LOC101221543 isoform X3 [Cucumis sativus]KGN51124.1 hypothetical protein Csa_008852 [Cucumis sativus]
MSLVDYASSDEDVPAAVEEEEKDNRNQSENHIITEPHLPKHEPRPQSPPLNQPIVKPNQQFETNEESSSVPWVGLPDASLLLNSPTSSSLFSGSDHSSRVAAAMAANASRKRETNVLGSSLPRSKFPRSSLPHSKNVPDTSGALLVPPQLTGRSNIVTEDISKLFVKKSAKPPL